MANVYVLLTAERARYIKDNQDMFLGGGIAIFIAYFMLSRPDFPSRYEYTWASLLAAYGFACYLGISLVAGWKLFGRSKKAIHKGMSLLELVFYLFLKFALALMVGGACFYGVFRLGNNLYQLRRVNRQLRFLAEHPSAFGP